MLSMKRHALQSCTAGKSLGKDYVIVMFNLVSKTRILSF